MSRREYAIVLAPRGEYIVTPRERLFRDDVVVGWRECSDDADARAKELNKQHAAEIAERKRRQLDLFS